MDESSGPVVVKPPDGTGMDMVCRRGEARTFPDEAAGERWLKRQFAAGLAYDAAVLEFLSVRLGRDKDAIKPTIRRLSNNTNIKPASNKVPVFFAATRGEIAGFAAWRQADSDGDNEHTT